MTITDVRVRKIAKEGKMKAIVSITVDDEFVVHDIKVIEGDKGLFIAMPSKRSADGEYRDIAHPINSGTRDMIQRVILDKYETTTLEEAQARLLEVVHCVMSEKVELLRSIDRILAEDVYAHVSQPPFERSAMDGYAVRSKDIRTVSRSNPVCLKLTGFVPEK